MSFGKLFQSRTALYKKHCSLVLVNLGKINLLLVDCLVNRTECWLKERTLKVASASHLELIMLKIHKTFCIKTAFLKSHIFNVDYVSLSRWTLF